MLIAKMLPIVAAFCLAGLASEGTSHPRLPLGLNGDRWSRVRKRQEDPEYFEQCRFVNVWREHLGRVSVLAFLDPTWQYSFRQAVMLNVLSSRLRISGFPDIRFFVISPSPDVTQDDETEDDDEIEAWRQIARMFPDALKKFLDTDVHISKQGESGMIVLQDSPRSRMWKRFRASRDQVVVIDRCGRLTYQVIVPWSILHFPYVKAAILSTYQEDPCGECDPSVYNAPAYKEHVSDLPNDTGNETDPRKADDVDTGTTERLENTSLHLDESSEQEDGGNIVSTVSPEEATDNTDRLDLVSVTESSVKSETTHQYDNDTTESFIEKSHPTNGTASREELMNSSHTTEMIAISAESQPDVTARQETFGFERNDSTSDHSEVSDRVLMLDEPLTINTGDNVTSDDIVAIETTTFSGDQASSGDGNANISFDNPTEYDPNDSVVKSEIEDAEPVEGVHSPLPLPLRIIMYAPHGHRDGEKTRKYTHLILKTDNPDYHEHLDSGISIMPLTDLSQNSDLQMANTKKNDRAGIKINGHGENTDQKYIFERDESPGLYGEIADYWRSCENSDITDRNETSNDNYNNSMISYNEQHRSDEVSNHSVSFSKSSEADKSYSSADITMINTEDSVNPLSIVKLDKINSLEPINESEQVYRKDEARNKLIEHYSRLLAWIDYRLNK